jgi:hypothetical protein
MQYHHFRRAAVAFRFFVTVVAVTTAAIGFTTTQSHAQTASPAQTTPKKKGDFPRLFGINANRKDYQSPQVAQNLAQMDAVMINVYRGWWNPDNRADPTPLNSLVQSLKRLNPNLLVGQYSSLIDDNDTDIAAKLDQENWWLRKANGQRVVYLQPYGTFTANATDWTTPDANGERFPQWQAKRTYNEFHRSGAFDFWHSDGMSENPYVSGDWNRDGVDDGAEDPVVGQMWRKGFANYQRAAHALAPNMVFMAQVDHVLDKPEWKGLYGAALMEGLMGQKWSIGGSVTASDTYTVDGEWQNWPRMMTRYHTLIGNLIAPKLLAFNVWGGDTTYRHMRYALASCLMNDGYFSYTSYSKDYGLLVLFDEYKLNLGRALEGARTVAWQNGVYRRKFERGMALVNPTDQAQTVTVEAGYQRFSGTQAPGVNNGQAVTTLTLPPRDGLILVTAAAPASTPPPPADANELIVDNKSANTSRVGTWTVSSAAGPWAAQSVYNNRGATFRWKVAPAAGSYNVYAWWTYHANRATNVPYRVNDASGLKTVVVNQRNSALAGKWNLLGTFTFGAGGGFVEVSSENGQANADAVRLVKGP